jgi:hypothetical protein
LSVIEFLGFPAAYSTAGGKVSEASIEVATFTFKHLRLRGTQIEGQG